MGPLHSLPDNVPSGLYKIMVNTSQVFLAAVGTIEFRHNFDCVDTLTISADVQYRRPADEAIRIVIFVLSISCVVLGSHFI